MKLLTQSGLLFSAVAATTATADGHYGAYHQLDWTATIAEGLQTATTTGTLGLNPMVRSLETTYDGGKLISGYGWYSGTVTTGWMLKLFGGGCGSSAVVAIPATPYSTIGLGTATTAATCITTSYWIWAALNDSQTNAFNRSTIVTDAAEEWKNGTLKATTVGGDVMYAAVGGLNTNATFGLGVWSMMIWEANHLGKSLTVALYGTGFVAETDTGANGSQLWQQGLKTPDINATTNFQDSALNVSNQSNCFTSAAMWAEAQKKYDGEGNIVTGGFAASQNGCLDYVIDETNISGIYVLMAFAKDLSISVTGGPAPGTAVTAQKPVASIKHLKTGANQYLAPAAPLDNASGNLIFSYNFGVLKQVEPINGDNNTAVAKVLTCITLFSAPEQYGKSAMQAHYSNTGLVKGADTTTFDLTQADYGMINRIWAFSMADSGEATGMYVTSDSHVAFTGMRLGKGVFSMTKLSTTRTAATAADTDVYATPSPAWLNATASGVTQVGANAYTRQISSPAGGIAQFKGLTQATANDKYVEVNCRMIAPHFSTAWKDISNTTTTTGSGGFLLSCMTGISQCINNHTATVSTRSNSNSLLTLAEHATCLNDPRYLTWRQMSIVMKWDGTVVWYRVDSYFNPAAHSIASSWGPGSVMSSHLASARDNTTITATDQSKSYVFALADGSGIQLSHITGGATAVTAATGNTTAGTGDKLTSSVATFSNTSPGKVEENYCSESKILLAGETATAYTALTDTVKAYTDGYKATMSLKLDYVLAGAAGGWRGACMVYYSTQYVADETNGVVCVAATQTATGLGADLAAVKLMHITATAWHTGGASKAVTPTGAALSDAKYSITAAPAAAAKYTFNDGYYASATWYQPKFAATYTTVGRFGKGNYAGAYCMQGAGSTSYFSQAGAGVALTSAATLAAGAVTLGSALLAM